MAILLGVVMLIVLGFGGYYFWDSTKQNQPVKVNTSASTAPVSYDKTATFSVETNGITRNFSDPKYHNQSSDVYIDASNPNLIHIRKEGITWGEFFNSLPMELSRECLITGDGEKFCDVKDGTLKLYLNGSEDPNFLQKEIIHDDHVIVRFNSF